jgi:hypothetical protein
MLVLVLGACASCADLDRALVLQEYSDEKEAQRQQVIHSDAQTAQLLGLARTGRIEPAVRTAAELRGRFGEPVLIRPLRGNSAGEEWLYRYQTKYLVSPKVYIRIDPLGNIQGVRYEGSDRK